VHGDPADRMIIATARHLGVPAVTRGSKIIDYAQYGEVSVVAR
jgi:PIN domain nuclease of toxin-antitoxin system